MRRRYVIVLTGIFRWRFSPAAAAGGQPSGKRSFRKKSVNCVRRLTTSVRGRTARVRARRARRREMRMTARRQIIRARIRGRIIRRGTALRTRSPETAAIAAVAVRRMLRSALRKHGTSLLHGWKAQRRQIFPLSWTGTTAGMCMKARSSTTGWSMSLRSTPIQAIS